MILCKIIDAELPSGVTHLGTDWQVATDVHFGTENIIAEFVNSTTYLDYCLFTSQLELDKTYYGRARRLLSTGYTVWSNIEMFTADDVSDILRNDNMPTTVSMPIISTNMGDYKNHYPTLFIINADEFGVYGNATHESTDWIVTDLFDNIIFTSANDTVNLTSLSITPDNLILDDGAIYMFIARFNTSSSDSSQFVAKLVHINSADRPNIIVEDTTALDYTVDNTLTLFNILHLVRCEYTITDINANGSK